MPPFKSLKVHSILSLRKAEHYHLVAVAAIVSRTLGFDAHPEPEIIDDCKIDSPDSIPQHSDIQAVQDSLFDFEAV